MKTSGKDKLCRLAVYLFIPVAVAVILLRVASRVSPTVRNHLDGVLVSHPVIFGTLAAAVMGGASWVSYLQHAERRTTGTLLRLVLWSSAAAAVLLYGLYLFWRGGCRGDPLAACRHYGGPVLSCAGRQP